MNRKLVVTDAPGPRQVQLGGTVAVGRETTCELSADDPLLSRRHAEFRTTGEGVVPIDLDSRNGVRVNGVSTRQTVRHNNDDVQIANLRRRFVEGTAATGTSVSPVDDDHTVVITPAVRRPLATAPVRPSSFFDDDTIILFPPAAEGAAAAAPRPAVLGARPLRPTRAAESLPAYAAVAKAGTVPVARKARTSWARRMFVMVVGLGASAGIVIALTMSLWHARSVNAMAVARATAIVQWLAAEAAQAATRGELSTAADGVLKEPGVVAAVVVGLDGRVLAPGSRAVESMNVIPGVGGPPSSIYQLRSARLDGLIYVAKPVLATRTDARQAIAFVTFRASAGADDASSVVLLGPVFLLVLAASLAVASLIRRTTLLSLAQFNEDVDLAISGQLDEVKDPLGARPVRDLADTLNYLIARVRGEEGRSIVRASRSPVEQDLPAREAAADPSQRASRSVAETSVKAERPGLGVEATILTDARFRITEASPECEQIIGLSPKQMLGEHLVDALQNRRLVEAVLTILGSLPASGRQEKMVARDSGAPLQVVVTRTGRDQSVAISIRAVESAVRA